MQTINIVTGNDAKFKQYEVVLGSKITIIQNKLDVPEIQSTNQADILKAKTEYAYTHIQQPIIIDETAIYFSNYHDFPGPLAKFVYQGLGIKGLFKLVHEGDPISLKTMICYKDGETEHVIDATMRGTITKAVDGPVSGDFPYMSFFIPEGYKLPFTLLSQEQQNEVLPRIAAIKRLLILLYGLYN